MTRHALVYLHASLHRCAGSPGTLVSEMHLLNYLEKYIAVFYVILIAVRLRREASLLVPSKTSDAAGRLSVALYHERMYMAKSDPYQLTRSYIWKTA